MKYCFNCGKQIHESTIFCPYCGARQGQEYSREYRNNAREERQADPNYNPFEERRQEPKFKGKFHVGWFFLGMAVPIAGLVLFFVWRKREPGKARSVGFGALAGVLLNIIVEVLLCVFVDGYFAKAYLDPITSVFESYGIFFEDGGIGSQTPDVPTPSGPNTTSYHFLN